MKTSELTKVEEIDNIASVYKLLSRVFIREIDKEFLKVLRSKDFYNALRSFGIDLGDNFLIQDEAELLEKLAVEYARLFLTGYNVPLYSSVYTNPNNLLCADSTQEVAHFYKRCGLKIKDKTLLPDHIGLELELMGYLKEKEAYENKDTSKWLELQNEFIAKHLIKWAERFFSDVEKEAEHPFYQQMARLGREFITSEVKDEEP